MQVLSTKRELTYKTTRLIPTQRRCQQCDSIYKASWTALQFNPSHLQIPYTRLVSYAELKDLRSPNQRWPDNVGNTVWRPKPNEPGIYITEDRENKPHRRPFVYMGPGIWFDQRTAGRRIHIRLAPTTNNIPNWPGYDPAESDPNQLQLALSVTKEKRG